MASFTTLLENLNTKKKFEDILTAKANAKTDPTYIAEQIVLNDAHINERIERISNIILDFVNNINNRDDDRDELLVYVGDIPSQAQTDLCTIAMDKGFTCEIINGTFSLKK